MMRTLLMTVPREHSQFRDALLSEGGAALLLAQFQHGLTAARCLAAALRPFPGNRFVQREHAVADGDRKDAAEERLQPDSEVLDVVHRVKHAASVGVQEYAAGIGDFGADGLPGRKVGIVRDLALEPTSRIVLLLG